MELKNINLDEIKALNIQPEWRTDDTPLIALRNSMQELGLICPVVLSKNGVGYKTVEGHRRIANARILGWKTIPAIISQVDARKGFLACNDPRIALKIRRKDYVGIFIKSGDAPKSVINDILVIVDVMGKDFLLQVHKKYQCSAKVIANLITMAQLLGLTTKRDYIKFIDWSFKVKAGHAVRSNIRAVRYNPEGHEANTIWKAYEEGKELHFKI